MKYPNVKAEMARSGLTAYELAERVGVSPTTMSLWLNGKAEPSIRNAIKVAEVLGRDVEYLFKTA